MVAGAEFGVAVGEGSFYETQRGICHRNSKFLRGRLISLKLGTHCALADSPKR